MSNANIIVKLPDAQKTIKPTAMTITEGTTETCTPITSVDITVDTPLGKTAYTATFTNSKSLSCSASGSTLTCTGRSLNQENIH